MIEMRREKRWPADISMEILSLYKQGNEKVENIHQPIDCLLYTSDAADE